MIFFFFQAEDGIRDVAVTGVQTCALPISEHQLIPKGLAPISPMGGLTLNAMVFKHSPYPNAAKSLLQFMMEKDQYEPWLNANSGYWSQPLAAYAEAAVWSGDPKVKIFKDVMKTTYYNGY